MRRAVATVLALAAAAAGARGAEARPIACAVASLPGVVAPALSPDGRFLAFAAGRRIEIVRTDHRAAVRVVGDIGPSPAAALLWSPDEEHLAVQEAGLWILSLRGGAPFFLGNAGAYGWSPDGRRLLLSIGFGFAFLDVDNLARILVPFGGSLSPDGRFVAFAGDDGLEVAGLFDGSRRLLAGHARPAGEVVWSPDGQMLAYVESRSGELIVLPSGREVAAATFGSPIWTPAGLYVDGGDVLLLADPAGGAARTLVSHSGYGVKLVSASGDGKLLAYALTLAGGRTVGYRLLDRAREIDRSLVPCTGTGGDDLIAGSALDDTVLAGSGADSVDVRGGGLDTVDCGSGRDTVVADRRDRIARDCERVRRV